MDDTRRFRRFRRFRGCRKIFGPLDWWELFSKLASAFGWTHQDILKLTIQQFIRYLDEIPKVEARKQVKGMEVSAYPHMEKIGQREVERYYSRILRPLTQRDIDSAWNSLKSMRGKKAWPDK